MSAAVWIGGGGYFFGKDGGNSVLWALLVIVAAKFVAFIWLMFLPRLRSMGAGILTSIAIGAMVFFGACAANISWN